MNNKMKNTRKLVVCAMLSAAAAVLMYFELPMPFIAPPFYKIDFSEIPVLIGSFSMGPVAGVIIEAVKVLLKLVIKGTETGGIGDLANFIVGCSLVVPASVIYRYKKTKKWAIISMGISTAFMAIVSLFMNAFVMIPIYSAFMPVEQIVNLGADIFPAVKDVFTFCLFCVVPFNLIKGLSVSIVTTLIYKPLARIIHPKNV